MTTDCGDSIHLELFVRSLAPASERSVIEHIVERLDELEAGGHIDEYSVHITGKQVCEAAQTASTDPGEFLIDRLEEFEAWADGVDWSITSTFPRIEGETIDGQDCSGVRFPTVALAEYVDDELRFVSPAADGGTVCTVLDRLDRLATAPDGPRQPVRDEA